MTTSAGEWCARCRHLVRRGPSGRLGHVSRDDWSLNAYGDYDCGCVQDGRDCTPEPRVREKAAFPLPRRKIAGLNPVLGIYGETSAFGQQVTHSGTVTCWSDGTVLTWADGHTFALAPDALDVER